MSAEARNGALQAFATAAAAAAGLLLLIGLAGTAPAAAQTADGESIYRTNCAACHQIDGGGLVGTFPPLVGNPHVDDLDSVIDTITNGRQGEIVVNGTTYDGVMPAFGGSLTPDEIAAVAAYVRSDLGSGTTATTQPLATITPVAEAALLGEQLFLGQEALEEGGLACAACHAVGEHGDLVGVQASLGPDLTDAWTRLGGAGGVVDAIRTHPGAAAALYEAEPLTVDEITALASYLEIAEERGAATLLDGLVLVAVALLGLLVAATAVVAAGRKEGAS